MRHSLLLNLLCCSRNHKRHHLARLCVFWNPRIRYWNIINHLIQYTLMYVKFSNNHVRIIIVLIIITIKIIKKIYHWYSSSSMCSNNITNNNSDNNKKKSPVEETMKRWHWQRQQRIQIKKRSPEVLAF